MLQGDFTRLTSRYSRPSLARRCASCASIVDSASRRTSGCALMRLRSTEWRIGCSALKPRSCSSDLIRFMPRRWAMGAYTSSVSRAMRSRAAVDCAPSVRMLCRRSASLIRMTRRSRAIASIILRKLSAAASWRLLNCSLSSLVTPSTSSATCSPNSSASSARVSGVSSMVSCRIAATRVSRSTFCSASTTATATGWVM